MMAGLDPAIHVSSSTKDVNAWVRPEHDREVC
jgi:hypothetical protein